MICVYIESASSPSYKEIRRFRDFNELMNFMRREYDRWIIDFNPPDTYMKQIT